MKKKLLQAIDNMRVGGAQRMVGYLNSLPGVDVKTILFCDIHLENLDLYDWIIFHTWCTEKNKEDTNFPINARVNKKKLLVFHHDARGILNNNAKGYMVYSIYAKNYVKADGPVEVVPGACDIPTSTASQERQFTMPLRIGRLSTMHSGKINIKTVEFWRKLPANEFVIAGDGSQREALVNHFREDKRFFFPGEISYENVFSFMRGLDIFLYDTAWHVESFCLVILEAMRSGCIVLAKDKGAISELIVNGVNGFLYKENKEAIDLINKLAKDPTTMESISNRAVLSATKYSKEELYLKMIWLLKNMLKDE